MRDAGDFQRAASMIGYTFNWFYVDAEHVAYYNSGANPMRAKGVDGQPAGAGRGLRVARLEPERRPALAVTPRRSRSHPQASSTRAT